MDAQLQDPLNNGLQLPIIERTDPDYWHRQLQGLKHIAFREERECRIVVWVVSESVREVDVWQEESDKQFKQIRYRSGACGTVPYIRLFEDSEIDLPITRIIVGPSLNQLVYFEKIRELVKDREIAVERSEIPYVGSTTVGFTFIQMAQNIRNKSLQNLLNLHVDLMIDGLINAGDT